MLRFEGDRDFPHPPAELFAKLTDARFLASCIPDVEKVSEQACVEFMDWWKTGAACDEHLADQLVLPAALIGGRSEWSTPRVTEHLRTVLWAVHHFLPIEHSFEPDKAGHTRITVSGKGILKT